VALVYSAVRRWFGVGAALCAGVAMAATPVAALMFRFNNPDALLVLLLTAGAYCLTRALERAGTRWLLACGALVGLGFLAKMGEALVVVPTFGLAYLVAAPARLRRRAAQLLAAGAALVASAGWWVLAVALWPAGSRPMIDGSPTNSILNLIVGYDGLERIVGNSGGGGGASFSGATGILRLFNSLMGGQASWLLPAALMALAGGLVMTRRARRTDRLRAALVIWGGWLVVTGAIFSFSSGIIHTYYTVALAPPVAVLSGIGASQLWKARGAWWARLAAGAVVTATAWWAWALLDRSPSWGPWLRPLVVTAAAVSIVGLATFSVERWRRGAGLLALGAAAIACLAGPLAFTVQTVGTAHTGSVPSAGPSTTGTLAGGGFPSAAGGKGGPSGTASGSRPQGAPGRATGGERTGPAPSGAVPAASGPAGSGRAGSGPAAAGGASRSVPSGAGGGSVTVALAKVLEAGAGHYRWAAATDGSQQAAAIELATNGDAVMAIGGFDGEGGNLSLASFEHYVKAGDIHYFVVDGGTSGGGPGGASSSGSITTWVESHFSAETVGGMEIYDLASSSVQ
jgi:hypothetical protein